MTFIFHACRETQSEQNMFHQITKLLYIKQGFGMQKLTKLTSHSFIFEKVGLSTVIYS